MKSCYNFFFLVITVECCCLDRKYTKSKKYIPNGLMRELD